MVNGIVAEQEPLPGFEPEVGAKGPAEENPDGQKGPGGAEEEKQPSEPGKETASPAGPPEPPAEQLRELQTLRDELAKKEKENANYLKGMRKGFSDNARLQQEMTELREMVRGISTNIASSQDPEKIEERARANYGMDSKQVKTIYEVARKATEESIAGLTNMLASQATEREREVLRSTDKDLAIPEVEEAFEALLQERTPQERMNPKVIRDCAAQAKAANFDAIVQRRMDVKLKEISESQRKKPNTPPPAVGAGTKAEPPKPKMRSVASDEQIANLRAMGVAVEDYAEHLTVEDK